MPTLYTSPLRRHDIPGIALHGLVCGVCGTRATEGLWNIAACPPHLVGLRCTTHRDQHDKPTETYVTAIERW
jgi:hypothetical protein